MSLGDALLHLKWILIYNSGITLLKNYSSGSNALQNPL